MIEANPDHKFCIIKPMESSVTRNNHVVTSPQIQTYAQVLKKMLPISITTTTTPNAWKQCSKAVLNSYDEEYPAMNESKRTHTDDTTHTDLSTNDETASETFNSNALDDLKSEYDTKYEALQQQLLVQNEKMEDMKKQLMQGFEQKLQQLEHKMESKIMKTLETYDQHIKTVMNNVKGLMDNMKNMFEEQLQQILVMIPNGINGTNNPKIGNTSHCKRNK